MGCNLNLGQDLVNASVLYGGGGDGDLVGENGKVSIFRGNKGQKSSETHGLFSVSHFEQSVEGLKSPLLCVKQCVSTPPWETDLACCGGRGFLTKIYFIGSLGSKLPELTKLNSFLNKWTHLKFKGIQFLFGGQFPLTPLPSIFSPLFPPFFQVTFF